MPINRIASRTRSWSALRRGALVILAAGGCSSPEQGARSDAENTPRPSGETRSSPNARRGEILSGFCAERGENGSLQVARVDRRVEEGGVAFDLLGNGAGSGVIFCRDTLYADVNALAHLMGDTSKVTENNGVAVVNGTPTSIPAYRHGDTLYVAVAPFVRDRRAVLLTSREHPMDAIVWPRQALLHLKRSGLTQGRAYQTAVREGLVPR